MYVSLDSVLVGVFGLISQLVPSCSDLQIFPSEMFISNNFIRLVLRARTFFISGVSKKRRSTPKDPSKAGLFFGVLGTETCGVLQKDVFWVQLATIHLWDKLTKTAPKGHGPKLLILFF
jgi:hypothetical protein